MRYFHVYSRKKGPSTFLSTYDRIILTYSKCHQYLKIKKKWLSRRRRSYLSWLYFFIICKLKCIFWKTNGVVTRGFVFRVFLFLKLLPLNSRDPILLWCVKGPSIIFLRELNWISTVLNAMSFLDVDINGSSQLPFSNICKLCTIHQRIIATQWNKWNKKHRWLHLSVKVGTAWKIIGRRV